MMNPCKVCGSFQESSPQTALGVHFAAIDRSAKLGCETCGILRDVTTRILSADKQHSSVIFHFNRYKGLLTIDTLDNHSAHSIVLHTLEEEQCNPWPAVKAYRHPVQNPSLDEYGRLIRNFIDSCSQNHAACQQVTLMEYVPTRLVHVGNYSSGHWPRLCETIESKEKGLRYVALSHCWGKTQALTTTKATLEERKGGIEWKSFSKTFQEAISITRAIGADYIWIDSLCIIQDDWDDWAREASRMASVYQHAYLTIGATAAVDGSQGLLAQHRPEVHHIFTNAFGKEKALCAWKMPDHDAFHFQNKSSVPLQSRAWTFQELLLSARFVHFGREELVYECLEETTCECGLFGTSQPRTRHHLARNGFFGSKLEESQKLKLWPELVQIFSARDITFARDRLPAISSLAGKFVSGEVSADQYLAGLWRTQLPLGLLWIAKHTKIQCPNSNELAMVKQTQTWAAWLKSILPFPKIGVPADSLLSNSPVLASSPPSWSWASLECDGISWDESSRYLTSNVLDAVTFPSTIDPLGMVLGGYITLQGQIFPLEDIWIRDEAMAPNEIQIPVQTTPGLQLKNGLKHFVECQLDDPSEYENSEHGSLKNMIYFLMIGQSKHDYGFVACQGLVLAKVSETELAPPLRNTTFSAKLLCKRIGLGMFRLPSNDYYGPSKAYKSWYTPRTVTIV